jgi:hypothetical protein
MLHQITPDDTWYFVKITRNLLYRHKRKHNPKAIQYALANTGFPDVPSLSRIRRILKEARERGQLL